ncbi:phage tail tape measure protein [Rhodococcus sp. AQ5-07]|uniref:phage tail tape measure protein n=1 Tax=Rhodococcus sp. AQ5-07 TaxID=2054902 RepID=UPI000DBFB2F3|nr:phage tail tape measure protein [Rhodococcus sp. AQ5-07]RAL31147.1 hypothetical protein CVN56_29705 [Rhodococcus sp. AQ5-07]
MGNIGWASLSIVPTINGVAGQISSQLVGPMRTGGQQAGQAAGQAVADGIGSAKAAVAKASGQLATARSKEADAAGNVRIAELKLQEVRDKGNASASQIAAAEEKLAAAQRKSESATSAAEKAVDSHRRAITNLTEARARAANAADDEAASTDDAAESQDRQADSAVDLAKKLGGLAVAAAGIGGAMDLAMTSLNNEAVMDKLAAQLGASPELAEEYGKSAGKLYNAGFGESLEEVTSSIGAVQSSLPTIGFEGEVSLDKATERAMNFAKTFDVDVTESIGAAALLIQNGLAKDSTEAMDLLTASAQRVPAAMRGELPAVINEYGTNFTALGFTGEEAMSLLVNASANGGIALDKTGDALKEFGIKATDLGDTGAQEALAGIGLSGTDMANKLLAGGGTAKGAFQQIVTGLQGIKDPAEQAAAATAIFGTPLEDLGKDKIPAFLQSLSGTENSMAGFTGAADEMGTTLNDNTGASLESLKRTIQGGLVEGLESMADWVGRNSELLKNIGLVVTPLVAGFAAYKIAVIGITAATTAWNAIQMMLNGTMALNPIGIVVAIIVGLVAAIVIAYNKSETFRNIVQGAWEGIKTAVSAVWDNVLKPIFDKFVEVLGWIGEKATWLWNEAIVPAFNGIKDAAGSVKDWITDKFTAIVNFFTEMPGKISSAASGMWDGLKNAFKSAINWILEKWNGLDFSIPSVEIAGVKFGGFTLGVPDIPLLASGGIAGRRRNGTLYGPGTGTSDSILGLDSNGVPTALVSNGEGIVTKSAMDSGGSSLVAALNAGWTPSALNLREMFPDLSAFAGGGTVSAKDLDEFAWGRGLGATKPLEGDAYNFGGVNWGDCSGAVSAFVNAAVGDDPFGSRGATGNFREWLAAKGLQPGKGGPGSLDVAWFNGGPGGGHTAATLPSGTKIEMGGGRGNGQINGAAAGANLNGATDFAHLPASFFVKDVGSPYDVRDGDIRSDADSVSGWGADSTSGTSASGEPAVEKAFNARDRWKQMFTDTAGVWADATIEIAGVGEWLDLADRYTITAGGDSSSSMTMAEAKAADIAQSTQAMDGGDANIIPAVESAAISRTGADLYAYEIARAAKEMGLGEAAAIIGEATALVEVGDPMKMFANSKMPDSLNLPHDAVGTNGTSTGLFQQQDFPEWGTLAQRMNPFESAKLFYDKFPDGWESMDPGAVAQSVQRSGLPDKYGHMIGRGRELVDSTSLFDTGGVWEPGTFGFNGLNEPELVLKDAHWKVAEANIAKIDDLVSSGAPKNAGIQQINHITVADQGGFFREQTKRQRLAIMQYT